MADFTPVEIEQLRLLLQKQNELLSIADDAAALDVVAGAGQETILDLKEETAATLNLADKTVVDKHDSSATKSLAISELVSFVSGQIGGGGTEFNKQGHFKWVAGGGDGGAGYKLNDIVYHNGITYISTDDNNTTEPGAALASWDIFYQNASTSVKGITQLQSTVDDTEENAATPKAINRRDVHDSTKTYKQGARVQDGFGGEWYEAVQDVPAGQAIVSNPTYWGEPAIGINNNIGVDNETAIGSMSYTVSDLGRTKYITSISTLTDSRDLPVMTGSNATLVGASIRIMRTGIGGADLTINGNGANIDSGGGVVPSLVLKPGDDALFVWLGSVWALLGSAAKRFTNPIFRSGTTTVSQTHTGMIIQSFHASFTANTAAGVVFNLPVSFRSTDYHVVGGDIGNACNVVCGAPITNSTFRGFLRDLGGVYLVASGAVWHAIGW